MNASEYICQFLLLKKIDAIFSVPGYANAPILAAAAKSKSIRPILTRHEASAAWMAYGYGLRHESFGVCSVTSGPGITNIISGLTSSYYNSIPLLLLAGQIESHKYGLGAFQDLSGIGLRSISAESLLSKVSKLCINIKNPEEIGDALNKVNRALSEGRPGPVSLIIPLDIQKSEYHRINSDDKPSEKAPGIPVRLIEDMIFAAKNPLVLIGRGCAKYALQTKKFLQSQRIPFCSTLQGKGIVNDPELGLGICGVAGSPRCREYLLEKCDLLLILGSSLNEFTTDSFNKNLFERKRIIYVDVEPRSLNGFVAAEVVVESDLGIFFTEYFADFTNKINLKPAISSYLDAPMKVPLDEPDLEKFHAARVMNILSDYLPRNALIFADSGNNAIWAAHYLDLSDDQRFYIDINSGCMGGSIIASMGARFSSQDRPVFSICGDGGFYMSGFELSTAAENNLEVTWLVLNDAKLGMVRQGSTNLYGIAFADELAKNDIYKLASYMGIRSWVISSETELHSALKEAQQIRGPKLLDIRFDDSVLPKVYKRSQKFENQVQIHQ